MTKLWKPLQNSNLSLSEQHVIWRSGRGTVLTHHLHIQTTFGFHSLSGNHSLIIFIFTNESLSLSVSFVVTDESNPCFVLSLQNITSANSESLRSNKADIAPFWPPNRSVMCCDTAGSGCQNSGPCSTTGQLFWRVLDWISASQQPAPKLTRRTLPTTHSQGTVRCSGQLTKTLDEN